MIPREERLLLNLAEKLQSECAKARMLLSILQEVESAQYTETRSQMNNVNEAFKNFKENVHNVKKEKEVLGDDHI